MPHGNEGTHHSVNDYSYTQVGDVYLKITSVESDKPWLSDYRMDEHINEINASAFISRYWDGELQTEVETSQAYVYEKTGMETGVLILNNGDLEIELTFDANGYGYGYSEWNASIPEGNITGWFNINFWSNEYNDPYDEGEFSPQIRFWLRVMEPCVHRERSIMRMHQAIGVVVTVQDDQGGMLREQFEITILDVFEDLDQDGIEDHLDPDDDNDGFSDDEEYAKGTDPRDANSIPNSAPDSLILTNTEILENQPIGTVVGKFVGSDPDEDELSYHLNKVGSISKDYKILLQANDGQVVVDRYEGKYRYQDLDGVTGWSVYSSNTNNGEQWNIRTAYHEGETSFGVPGASDQLDTDNLIGTVYSVNEEGVYIWNDSIEYTIQVSVDNGIVKSYYQSDIYDFCW